ncbi:unnamed protein product, partial [marine sediment metagenome]
YRSRINFTFASLRAAQWALSRLRLRLTEPDGRATKTARARGEHLRRRFWSAIGDDLGLPRALAVAWQVGRSRLPAPIKRELLMDFDRLLGLDLVQAVHPLELPGEIPEMVREREQLRRAHRYPPADAIRERVMARGFEVRDAPGGSVVMPLPGWARAQEAISGSGEVESLLEGPTELDFTVGVVAREGCEELERCLDSIQRWLGPHRAEVIVVDNGLEDECARHLDEVAHS